MATSAVLLGYNLFDSGNVRYKGYVEGFAKFVCSNGIGRIVLCGGRTDAGRPSVSEAASIYKHIKPMLGAGVDVMLEEESLTSFQNIELSKGMVDLGGRIFLFCASIKLPKIIWYVMHYWLGMKRTEIVSAMLNYSRQYDSRHLTTEEVGRALAKGLTYRNVTFMPYELFDVGESGLGNILSTLTGVEVLYNRKLYGEFLDHARRKRGLKAPEGMLSRS